MHGAIAWLVHTFGVLGVALGAGLEGETAVVIGGLLARHGAFPAIGAAAAAWLGSFAADQAFFGLGRWNRDSTTVQRVCARTTFQRALRLIDRHPILFCIGFRFIYGFRVAGPVAIGISHIPARFFLILNAISAAIWATIFTAIGYKFGVEAEHFLRKVLTPAHLLVAFPIIAAIVAVIWVRHFRSGEMA